jgi:GTP cyclohydrolase I
VGSRFFAAAGNGKTGFSHDDKREVVNGRTMGQVDRPETGLTGEGTVDQQSIQEAVRRILIAVGEDPDREGLLETPDRVARMYAELLGGMREDPGDHLQKFFSQKYDEMVLVKDIKFSSMCEHHMLPFMGVVHIGYLPKGRVIGLSKLARVVDVVSRKLQVQERMTEEIAELLMTELDANGVAVVVSAVHMCMAIRGVRQPASSCVTSAMLGNFKTQQPTRAEFLSLIAGAKL